MEQLVVEAENYEQAEKIANSRLIEGYKISNRHIINDGRLKEIEISGLSVEEALELTKKKIQNESEVKEQIVIQEAIPLKNEEIIYEYYNQYSSDSFLHEDFTEMLKNEINDFKEIKNIEILKPGCKGLFGIFKKETVYKITFTIHRLAIVKTTYKGKYKVRFSISKKDIEDILFGGNINELKSAIDNSKLNVSWRDESGYTLLMYSSLYGHDDFVEYLLSLEPVNATIDFTTSWGATALTIASKEGETKIVKHLLSSGAKIDLEEHDGYTALSRAAMNGHIEIVKLLIAKKANKKIKTKHGHTAYSLAIDNKHHDIAKLLP